MWASDSMLWHWLAGLTLIVAGTIAMFWGLIARRLTHDPRRRCPKCAYDLSATPGLQCPECGRTTKDEHRLFRKRRQWWMGMLGLIAIAGGLVAMVRPLPVNQAVILIPDRVLMLLWKYRLTDELWHEKYVDPVASSFEMVVQHRNPSESWLKRLRDATLYRIEREQDPMCLYNLIQLAGVSRVESSRLEPLIQAHLRSKNRALVSISASMLAYVGFEQIETAQAMLEILQNTGEELDIRESAAKGLGKEIARFPQMENAFAEALDMSVMRYDALIMSPIPPDALLRIIRHKLESQDPVSVQVGLVMMRSHAETKKILYPTVVNIALARTHPARVGAQDCIERLGPSIDGLLVNALLTRNDDSRLDTVALLRRRGGHAKKSLPALRSVADSGVVDERLRQACREAITVIDSAPIPESLPAPPPDR